MGNAIEVFYFDSSDLTSCQHKCQLMAGCSHFTMMNAGDMKKCFLFESCDSSESCADCVSGPETPDYEPCKKSESAINLPAKVPLRSSRGAATTCETSVHNVIGIYYFDKAETH